MENTNTKEWIRALKFTIISISAGMIQVFSFTFFTEVFRMPYWPSYLIALLLSIVWNFTINRKYTFYSANNVPIAMLKVLAFYAVFTPLSTWWGDALTKIGWNAYLVLGGTMIINFVSEFLYQRIFVFGKSIDTAVKKKAV